jgi:hypothetical protein
MEGPPSYPPPPDQPPTGFQPVVAIDSHPPPQREYRVSRKFWLVISAVVVVITLLVGIFGYVVAGYAYASSRISNAAGAVSAISSHRTLVNTTFALLDEQVASLELMTDNKLAKSTSAKLVEESHSMSSTIAGDEDALVTARSRLNDRQWLTGISSGRLTAETGRVDRARLAVAAARSAARDYAQFGGFLQIYYQALIDWDTMVADANTNDFVGTTGADTALQADVATAIGASNAPGLPQEFHDYLVALQGYAADVGKLLNAISTRDKTALDAANKLVLADVAKLNAVDFTTTTSRIRSYYQRYRDDFNADLDRATA